LPKAKPKPKPKTEKIGTKTKDLMEVPPNTMPQTATIDDAATVMWEKNMGSVIAVDDSGAMTGILTERDILFAVSKNLIGRGVPISSIMSKTSLFASPNESIVTAVDRMTKGGVRHLPVVDKDGKPVGMVSMRDAMSISEPLLKYVLKAGKAGRKKRAKA
jgi:CBS domain-containing protein